MELSFDIIDTETWRKEMVRLWDWNRIHNWIPLYDNPYGMIQYTGRDMFERIVTFPIQISVDGTPAGWTCIHNISDTHLRFRGTYVLPEYRGNKLAPKLMEYAVSLWPKPWHTVLVYLRNDTYEYFCRSFGFELVEGAQWMNRIVPDNPQVDQKIILAKKQFRVDANDQSHANP